MDEECIDAFKLNRFELLFYHLNNFNLFKRKAGFGISDLGTIAIALVVAAVILGMGSTILENITMSTSAVTDTANVSSVGLLGMTTIIEFFPTIAIVAIAAVVLGVILVSFGRTSVEDDVEDINNKEPLKEEYKDEPDYDDAKKSRWGNIFRRNEK